MLLPHIPGRVDLYPNDQLVLVANGLNRSSRPVFQSYFAYTPRLIALNETHLQGGQRPRTVFVDIAPIDGHWPTSEDAPSLISILSDYDLRQRTRVVSRLPTRVPQGIRAGADSDCSESSG